MHMHMHIDRDRDRSGDRGRGRSKDVRREGTAATFSHAEFEALPLKVQSAFFSSLERLRIAEQQFIPSAPSPPCSSHRRRRLRKLDRPNREIDTAIDVSQLAFYQSLPPKVRKRHLSPEEQQLLSFGTCQSPSNSLHDRGSARDRARGRARQRLDDFNFDFGSRRKSVERGPSPPHLRSLSPRSPQHGILKPSLEAMASTAAAPPTPTPAPSRAPFRRTLSLTSMPLPFRHSTSSAPTMADPSLPFFSSQAQSRRQRSASQTTTSGRRSSHAPVAPVFDPEATHYRDPEARKKLRMFLASPQKFDEAVEFGFPSSAGNDVAQPSYQLPPINTDARNFSRDFQTFLRDEDDRISFLDNDQDNDASPNPEGSDSDSDMGAGNDGRNRPDSDGDSLTDVESPITPSSIGLSFRGHTRGSPSNFSSLDSTGLPPLHALHGRLNREMTLRMTLTRPDLRADEDQLYGWRGQKGGKDDPFALEELHFTDDVTGANGAFAVKPKAQGNLVSRLFKRASRKGGW